MKLQPWQLDMLKKMSGFKKGELAIMTAGRAHGKSYWTGQAIDRLMKDLMNRPVEELVLTESRFAGARYYTVEPIGGNWIEMEAWCAQTFGEASEIWDSINPESQFMWPELGRWYKNDRKFWFRNEADRTLFVMKWR